MAVADKVTTIIVESLGVEPQEVTAEASFIGDLGADSLDVIELALALEAEFGIAISDVDIQGFTCVRDVVAYIEGRGIRA